MSKDQLRGTSQALDERCSCSIGFRGLAPSVAFIVVLTTMGCSMLPGGQASHQQTPGQAPPASTTSAAGSRPAIVLGSATGAPGQDVTLVATLQSAGTHVAGTQNDLTVDTANASLGAGGKPSCRVNAAIGKNGSAFSLRPNGCQGAACTTVRALVLSMDNTDPIPDGATLYTCTVHISPSAAPGQYPIGIGGVILSTPAGQKVPNAAGRDGAVIVSGTKH